MSVEKKSHIKICPSMLSSDFSRIEEEAKRVEDSGADWMHLDIMDGHFVQNLTFGPQIVAAFNRSTSMFLDVHLMMYNPYDYIERFVEAGADMITFHFEATEDIEETLDYIRKCNVQAGLALRPETSAEFLPKYLPYCDMVLLMTVNPGFGGQSFMPEVLDKVRYVRHMANTLDIRDHGEQKKEGLPFDIQVDGGITDETARLCADAGANVFVAGSYLFGRQNMQDGIQILRREASKYFREDQKPKK